MKQVTPELWRAIHHTLAVTQLNPQHNVREELIETGKRLHFTEEDLIECHVINPLPAPQGTPPVGSLKGARRK